MSCGFRINEKAFIGVTIRKTGGKDTVPYKNVPFSNSEIVGYTSDSFQLKHKQFPRNNVIRLDFKQIPLMNLTIVDGVIEDEMVFVEMLVGSQSSGSMMELVKTDSDEYREFAADLAAKNSKEILKLKDLKPGDIVISALCEAGVEIIYLGKMAIYEVIHGSKGRSWEPRDDRGPRILINTKKTITPYFAIKRPDGLYDTKTWPISNKAMKEFFATGKIDKNFIDIEKNMIELQIQHSVCVSDTMINDTFKKSKWRGYNIDEKRYEHEIFKEYNDSIASGLFKQKNSNDFDVLYFVRNKKTWELDDILNHVESLGINIEQWPEIVTDKKTDNEKYRKYLYDLYSR